ncbi:hypothetical protein [Ottowia sp.]|uniref:hypothetical protein n=1 Tax=Ottowia sp. TaxID=1898956 RepID=UPI003A8896D6
MNPNNLSDTRRLLIAWASLMLLTLISMASALLHSRAGWQPLSAGATVLVFVATAFKAWQIVAVYLNLRASTRGWMSGVMGLILLGLLVEAGAYLMDK